MHSSGTWRLITRLPKVTFRRWIVALIERTIKAIVAMTVMMLGFTLAVMLMDMIFRWIGVA